MKNLFKYAELTEVLRFMKANFKVIPLGKWRGQKGIILRHDVDFDIEPAYRLAMIEKECGILSTFFILISSFVYNPFSAKNRKMIKEMVDAGFEIGLHFDPQVYGQTPLSKLKEKVLQEAKILSTLTGKKVQSISLHNPSSDGKFHLFKGFRNAYDKKIFADDRYMSDSRMVFKKNIIDFCEISRRKPVQILLHPLHYTQKADGYRIIINRFLRQFAKEIDKMFRVNPTYCREVRGKKPGDFGGGN